jgi:flagellar biosynthetic protein FlhB
VPEERFGERTEPATPRRREEARERGQVARSTDLANAVILLAALLVLLFGGRALADGIARFTVHHLGEIAEVRTLLEERDPRDAAFLLLRASAAMGTALLPFLAVVVAAALAVHWLQVGFLFTTTPLEFDLTKLDPVAGFRRFFTLRGFMRAAMGVAKLAVLVAVAGWTLYQMRWEFLSTAQMDFPAAVGFMVRAVLIAGIRIAIALLLLAILDYAYQRYQYEQDLRMSRQEIKEELKRYEGDPKIKERRRRVQMQLALQRMLGRVPRATVVITNPTEYAVALEYSARAPAPVVTAKGRGRLAERIRNIALEHGVPIHREPWLARALYDAVEVGQAIPPELYEAVAQVLAFLYRTGRFVPQEAAS